jgi:iron(III) transport system substrate-binding protein
MTNTSAGVAGTLTGRRGALRLGIGAALFSGAVRQADAQATGMPQSLVDAARREGHCTVYSVVDPTLTARLIAGFTAAFGVQVSVQRLISGAMYERFAREIETGNPVADLIIDTNRLFARNAGQKNWLAPIADVPGVDAVAAALRTPFSVVIGRLPYSLVWNTADAKTVAADWHELLAPQWSGRVLLIDPRTAGNPFQWYYLMRQTYGDDFLRQLGRGATFAASVVPGLQQIAAQAMGLYAPAVHQVVVSLLSKGAPIGEVFPEPTLSSDNILMISAKATHPNAARLFAAYTLTLPGQETLNADGFSPLPNIPGTHPMPKLTDIDPDAAEAARDQITALLMG